MRHIEKALKKMDHNPLSKFIEIENAFDEKNIVPKLSFTIQSDPIGEVGVNGCQVVDMLEYTKCLFESLNEMFPCMENRETISNIQRALDWQDKRTKDRIKRKVEGENKE